MGSKCRFVRQVRDGFGAVKGHSRHYKKLKQLHEQHMQEVIVRVEKALEHLANEKDFIFQAVFNQDDLPYSLYCLFNALIEREKLESVTRHMTNKEADLFLDLATYSCHAYPSRQPVTS